VTAVQTCALPIAEAVDAIAAPRPGRSQVLQRRAVPLGEVPVGACGPVEVSPRGAARAWWHESCTWWHESCTWWHESGTRALGQSGNPGDRHGRNDRVVRGHLPGGRLLGGGQGGEPRGDDGGGAAGPAGLRGDGERVSPVLGERRHPRAAPGAVRVGGPGRGRAARGRLARDVRPGGGRLRTGGARAGDPRGPRPAGPAGGRGRPLVGHV